MESVKWWQSNTIRASIVAALAAAASLIGHNIDAGTQEQLIKLLTSISDLITLGAAVWAGVSRTQASTVIAGSSGEKAAVASGTTVTPKAPNA